jgi:GT2 family glycosyltransferase
VLEQPSASVIIPTGGRPDYLDVALRSVMPQAGAVGAEVIVVDDGAGPATAAVARRHGAELVVAPPPGGLNRARNAGIAAARSELVVLIDDDIAAPAGWLQSLLAGVKSAPDADVFGGPIRARLEGRPPRSCGREKPPITTLDLGDVDRDVALVWGANMAIRRRAFARVGLFDETLSGPGDEEDWERRYSGAGGAVRYVAAAGLVHRRSPGDSTLRRLSQAAYRQGRASRRYDVRKDAAPSLRAEVRTLVGCHWHIVRRRCANGLVLAAHAAGRLREALRPQTIERPQPEFDVFSGTSGQVWGIRATTQALVRDAVCDAVSLARLTPWRLPAAARSGRARRVLAIGVERQDVPNILAAARSELLRSRHQVDFVSTTAGTQGKFENLNQLLATHPATGYDWLLLVDDDVALPGHFLDEFLFLAERYDLALAQPAHRWRSHAAWAVTRRRPGVLARQTRFVEIGPVCALHSRTFDALLPFPALRFGWGLDLHWSAIARDRGWREGVVDATPIRHGLRQIATSYDRGDAVAETRRFLADRPYTTATEAQSTLAAHRRW